MAVTKSSLKKGPRLYLPFVEDEEETIDHERKSLSGRHINTPVYASPRELEIELQRLLEDSFHKQVLGIAVDVNLTDVRTLESVGNPEIYTENGRVAGLKIVEYTLARWISEGIIPNIPIIILSANPLDEAFDTVSRLKYLDIHICRKKIAVSHSDDVASTEDEDILEDFDEVVDSIVGKMSYREMEFTSLKQPIVTVDQSREMFDAVAGYLGLTSKECPKALGFCDESHTVGEYFAGKSSFPSRDWFDRLNLLVEFRAVAHQVFDGKRAVQGWFRKNDRLLGNIAPADIVLRGSILDLKRLVFFMKHEL